MSDVVTFCRALGDSTRWRITRLVMNEALCVCELAEILDMPQSSVSSHVQIIRKAGLLESEKCEKWTYFRIDKAFLKIIAGMEKALPSAEPAIWAEDEKRTAERLAVRKESCCPGPRKLLSRRKPISSSSCQS